MRIGVPKERLANETRVAATPKTVEQLLKLGFTVAVESGAGKLASFDDEAFIQAGAEVVDGADVWQSPVILKVNAPEESEIALLNPGTTLVSFIWPAQNPELMEKLAARGVTEQQVASIVVEAEGHLAETAAAPLDAFGSPAAYATRLIDALQRRDYPVVQGGVLLVATMIILVNLLVDLLYGVVNPRIRHKK